MQSRQNSSSSGVPNEALVPKIMVTSCDQPSVEEDAIPQTDSHRRFVYHSAAETPLPLRSFGRGSSTASSVASFSSANGKSTVKKTRGVLLVSKTPAQEKSPDKTSSSTIGGTTTYGDSSTHGGTTTAASCSSHGAGPPDYSAGRSSDDVHGRAPPAGSDGIELQFQESNPFGRDGPSKTNSSSASGGGPPTFVSVQEPPPPPGAAGGGPRPRSLPPASSPSTTNPFSTPQPSHRKRFGRLATAARAVSRFRGGRRSQQEDDVDEDGEANDDGGDPNYPKRVPRHQRQLTRSTSKALESEDAFREFLFDQQVDIRKFERSRSGLKKRKTKRREVPMEYSEFFRLVSLTGGVL